MGLGRELSGTTRRGRRGAAAVAVSLLSGALSALGPPALAEHGLIPNQTVQTAMEVTAVPFRGYVSGYRNSRDPAGQPKPSCTPFGFDSTGIWYRFQPQTSETLVVDDHNIYQGNTFLSIWSGTSSSNLIERACDTPRGGDRGQSMSFAFEAGTTYYFRIGVSLTDPDLVWAELRVAPPAAGNSFSAPLPLAEGQPASLKMIVADQGDDPADHCFAAEFDPATPRDARSVWLRYDAPATGAVTIEAGLPLLNSSNREDRVSLGVYTGPDASSLTRVTCHFPPVGTVRGPQRTGFVAQAGVTYWIQVQGRSGAAGAFDVSIRPDELPVNDDHRQATPITVADGQTVRVTGNVAAATVFPGEPSLCRTPVGPELHRESIYWKFHLPERRDVMAVASADFALGLMFIKEPFNDWADGQQYADGGYNGQFNVDHETAINTLAPGDYLMRVEEAVGGGPVTVDLTVFAPPPNDDLAEATDIPGPPFSTTVTNVHATTDNGVRTECEEPGPTVWYRYRPATEMGIYYDSNMTVAVYEERISPATSVSDLDFVECKYTTRAVRPLHVSPDRTYYFKLSSSPTRADGTFSTWQAPFWFNHRWQDSLPIGAVPYENNVVTDAGATTPLKPSCSPDSWAPSWYRYTPSVDTRVVADTTGSTYRPVLGLFEQNSDPFASPRELACVSTATGSRPRVAWTARAGKTYYIVGLGRYQGYPVYGTDNGEMRLTLKTDDLHNDDPSSPVEVASLPFREVRSTANAFALSDEPAPTCAGSVNASVWYRVRVAATTGVQVDTRPSSMPTAMSIRRGSPSGPETGCTTDGLTAFRADPEQDYYVVIAGRGQLDVSFGAVPVPANDTVAGAVEVTSPRVEQLALDGFIHDGTSAGAGEDPDEDLDVDTGSTVWFRYDSTMPLALRASVSSPTFEARVRVFEVAPDGSLFPVWAAPAQAPGEAIFSTMPMTTYLFQVSGDGGRSGSYRFSLAAAGTG